MFILKILALIIPMQFIKIIIKYACTNIVEFLAKNIDSSLKTENYVGSIEK